MTEHPPTPDEGRSHCWVFPDYFCREDCPYKHKFGLMAKLSTENQCALAAPKPKEAGRA